MKVVVLCLCNDFKLLVSFCDGFQYRYKSFSFTREQLQRSKFYKKLSDSASTAMAAFFLARIHLITDFVNDRQIVQMKASPFRVLCIGLSRCSGVPFMHTHSYKWTPGSRYRFYCWSKRFYLGTFGKSGSLLYRKLGLDSVRVLALAGSTEVFEALLLDCCDIGTIQKFSAIGARIKKRSKDV